jgi:hypothetical protein
MNVLFDGLLQFKDNEELDELIKSMDSKLSLKLIEFALDYAQKSGAYDFQESYLIYKCLEVLKKQRDEKI